MTRVGSSNDGQRHLTPTSGDGQGSSRGDHGEGGVGALETDLRWQLICRVVDSPHFAKAPKLQQFLRYTSERSLLARLDEITEQQIGVHVFGRTPDYNPGEDNIVRSYARTLRKRLEDYFDDQGRAEEIIADVPRGGYITVFRARTSEDGRAAERESREAVLEPVEEEESPATGGVPETLWRVVGRYLVVAVLAGALCFWWGRAGSAASRSSPALHRFWREIAGDSVLLWVPSDTGLTMILGLTKRTVSVAEYVTGEYLHPPGAEALIPDEWARLGVHRYTDLMDVLFVNRFLRLPELGSEKTVIRYARDLRADELKRGNAVLIGGINGNPWVQLFDHDLTFQLAFVPGQRTFEIRNRHPQRGERSSYEYSRRDAQGRSYGLVALSHNLSGTGWVLVIEGVSSSGLQVGADYLLHEESVRSLLKRASDGAGHLRPFELLLRTYNVASNATSTEELGFRVH